MELIKVIEDLIRFKSETGNEKEIDKCLEYIEKYFHGTNANVEVFRFENASPVIFVRNNNDWEQDVLVLGHIDVVKASDEMYEPKIEDGKMYARGSLDMKSFAGVAMNSMKYVLDNNLKVKFGVLLSTDEEKGSHSTHAFLEKCGEISAKVVLDNDVGGDIGVIINKCKNPVFVKLKAKGVSAHGSTPWDGLDANERLMKTIGNLRRYFPYYDLNTGKPNNTWIDTMHVAKICGGDVSNIISDKAEALLDIRLVETSSVEELEGKLKSSMEEGVEYEIVSSSTPVVMDENNEYIVAYKKLAENILGKEIEFEQIGGATDARLFAERGAVVVMHSGSGEGMHGDNEYVEIESVKKIAEIQIEYLKTF